MYVEDIHVGDTVRFRTWEDMMDEFGEGDNGSINCLYGFCDFMAPLCGKTFRVENISGERIYLEDENGNDPSGLTQMYVNISADMLERDKEVELNPFDCNEINVLLGL